MHDVRMSTDGVVCDVKGTWMSAFMECNARGVVASLAERSKAGQKRGCEVGERKRNETLRRFRDRLRNGMGGQG